MVEPSPTTVAAPGMQAEGTSLSPENQWFQSWGKRNASRLADWRLCAATLNRASPQWNRTPIVHCTMTDDGIDVVWGTGTRIVTVPDIPDWLAQP